MLYGFRLSTTKGPLFLWDTCGVFIGISAARAGITGVGITGTNITGTGLLRQLLLIEFHLIEDGRHNFKGLVGIGSFISWHGYYFPIVTGSLSSIRLLMDGKC
ncbi:2414_t:CDS:1, partial [Cetraspora pellucida]